MSDAKKKDDVPEEPQAGFFPIEALSAGKSARRIAWADDFAVRVGMRGNRGKRVRCFQRTGLRAGLTEWKADRPEDILADDWIVLDDEEAPAS